MTPAEKIGIPQIVSVGGGLPLEVTVVTKTGLKVLLQARMREQLTQFVISGALGQTFGLDVEEYLRAMPSPLVYELVKPMVVMSN